uniref:Hemocyanin subunit 1 n=1 Tax=Endeis spinosa TaxID=136194 RepID=G8YZQ9_9CHEL|nr:hemocyanin subunit 1 [Endeis spinosa]
MALLDKQKKIIDLFYHLSTPPMTEGAGEMGEHMDARLHNLGSTPRRIVFSVFHEKHLKEATELFEILIAAKDFDDFYKLSQQARSFVNVELFAYSLSVAILHRDDCKGIQLPSIQEIFPDRFVPFETIYNAFRVAQGGGGGKDGILVKIAHTGNILDPEYKLAYYREDLGINGHHWHWHLVYPASWRSEVMGKKKDRKGELFFYMHQQMVARYDQERLANGMQRMKPFHNWDEPMEGYAPHLTSLVDGQHYGVRPTGMKMSDVKDVDIQDMMRWRDRFMDAVNLGYVIDRKGQRVDLTTETGIDVLGALVESSYDSINAAYYGSLHNWGHVIMASAHDPDGRYQENPGVMCDTSTALRDPIFYRWHKWMDEMFQTYKSTLPSYSKTQLMFPSVKVNNVTLNASIPNVVGTFWKTAELEMSEGINFGKKGSVKCQYQHIDHEPFSYLIEVDNANFKSKHATVRIFMAAKHDELGNEIPLDDQRRMMIELDKFKAEIPPGKSSIKRASKDSSVIVKKDLSIAQLRAGETGGANKETCSCGWPEHLLVPRGNHRGMVFDLVVILTDWEEDKATDTASKCLCKDAVSYCGSKDEKYPDKKPMGFPFDRKIGFNRLSNFLTPNMKSTEVRILFKEN